MSNINIDKFVKAFSYVVAFVIGVYVTSLYFNAKINKKEKEVYKEKMTAIIINDHRNKQNELIMKELKENEEKSYEKIKSLEDANSKLLADVNDYNIRLYAYARNTSGERISGNSNTCTFDGEAARVELDRRTSSKLIEITKKADMYKSMLEELQNYIKDYNEKVKKTVDKKQ